MNLQQLAGKPQLVKVTIDDEDTIKAYGEAIDFWTWDRQPMDVFLKLANASQADTGNMFEIIKTMLLDEQGQEILRDGDTLPTKIMLTAIGHITDMLGK